VADAFDVGHVAYRAPEAVGYSWYPETFLAPIADNEPRLSSALRAIDRVVSTLSKGGFTSERVLLGGFSQGACLVAEYVVRHPRRFAGLLLYSGGLIGPPGTVWPELGSLEGTPALVACSDADPHVPLWRVEETAEALSAMGAEVDLRVFPGMGHTINLEEIELGRSLLLRAGSVDGIGDAASS
jgi:predicted esterase